MSIVGSDNKIFIWNVGMAEMIAEVDMPDIPLSASWNWDGSKLVATCKDKKIRVLDPRTGNIEKVISIIFIHLYSYFMFLSYSAWAVTYAGPHKWNDLRDELRFIANVHNFKKKSEDSVFYFCF